MAAVPQGAMDTMPRRLGLVMNMIAGEPILSGQVVAFSGSGADMTVWRHVAGTTAAPLGVSLYTQNTTGGKIAIASTGSILKVKNALDTAPLVAGTQIRGSGVTAGHVIADSSTADTEPFGVMLEALPASTVGAYALIFGAQAVAKGAP